MSSVDEESGSVKRSLTLVEAVFARREFGVVVAVLALFLIGSLVETEVFLTGRNLSGVLRNAAVIALIGYGMTMLITAGEFDLSVGSVMAVAAGITALMVDDGFSMVFILLVVLLLATLYGIGQGLLVTKLGLPSLIVTIGTLTLLRGAHLILTGNVSRSVPSAEKPTLLWVLGSNLRLPFDVTAPFSDHVLFTIPVLSYTVPFIHVTQQTVNRFQMQILWVLVFLVAFHYLLFYTRYGYHAQATGGNRRAARYTGIKTDQVKIVGFVLVAVMAAFAGMSQLAFTGTVSPLTGRGQELIVIAAVVIGGTNLFGGEGSMTGTLLGALIFSFTQNILVLAGFGARLFAVFTGVFIILAVGLDALTRKTRSEKLVEGFIEPLRSLLRSPTAFYQYVDEEVQGIDAPVGYLTLITLIWMIPVLLVVLLTLITNPLTGSPMIPLEFSVLTVRSGAGVFGRLPTVAFGVMAILAFLSMVFVHALARAVGGLGDIEKTIQAVSYAFTPLLFLFVPFIFAGLPFIPELVIASAVPIAAAMAGLLFVGLREMHDLSTRAAAIVIVGTLLLWAMTGLYVASQLA